MVSPVRVTQLFSYAIASNARSAVDTFLTAPLRVDRAMPLLSCTGSKHHCPTASAITPICTIPISVVMHVTVQSILCPYLEYGKTLASNIPLLLFLQMFVESHFFRSKTRIVAYHFYFLCCSSKSPNLCGFETASVHRLSARWARSPCPGGSAASQLGVSPRPRLGVGSTVPSWDPL